MKPAGVFYSYSELFDQQFSGVFLCYLQISEDPSWKVLHHIGVHDFEIRYINAGSLEVYSHLKKHRITLIHQCISIPNTKL